MQGSIRRHLECPICKNQISRWRLLFSIKFRKHCPYCKSSLSITTKSRLFAEIFTSIVIIAVIIYWKPQKIFIYPNVIFFVIFSIVCFWGFMIYFVEIEEVKDDRDYLKYVFYTLIFVLTIVVITGIVFYIKFYKYRQFQLKIPTSLKQPGIIVNKTKISKTLFLKNVKLGSISDITINSDSTIVVVGNRGVALLNSSYKIIRRIKFSGKIAHVDIIKDNDMNIYFLNRGRCNCCDASLINWDGRVIWSHKGDTCIFDTAYGDMDKDGNPEFAVGFNGKGGIHLLNKDGRVIWAKQSKNVWHIEISDINSDGINEIIHTNAAGEIVVRDKKGNILIRRKPDVYVAEFSIINWNGSKYLLYAGNGMLWLLNFSKNKIFQLEAPYINNLSKIKGIVLVENDENYLAVLANFRFWQRSVLYIYDEHLNLIYAEKLGNSCELIKKMRYTNNTELLLVGCNDKIWKYKL